MFWLWLLFGQVAIFGPLATGNETSSCGESSRILFRSPGNVSITGIFNAHKGENCSEPTASGLEHAAAAIWAVHILNHDSYLSGLQIGLTILDGCYDEDEMKKSFVQSLVLENCMRPDTVMLGIFTTVAIQEKLDTFVTGLNKTLHIVSPLLSTSSYLAMVGELLREMSFTTIHRVIADSPDLLNDFGRKMAFEGICVYDEVTTDDTHAANNEVLQPPLDTNSSLVSSGPPVIVILASAARIRSVFGNLGSKVRSIPEVIWLLTPLDSALEIDNDILPNRTLIMSAVIPRIEDLKLFFERQDLTADPLNHRQPSKSPFFLSVTATLLKLLAPIKEIKNKNCSDGNSTCSRSNQISELSNLGKLSRKLEPVTSLAVRDIKQVLTNLKVPEDNEMFLFSVTEKFKKDDVAVFEIYDPENEAINPNLLIIKERRRRSIVRLGIDDIKRRGSTNDSSDIDHTSTSATAVTEGIVVSKKVIEKHPCHDVSGNLSSDCGICLNFVKYLSKVAQEKETEEPTIEIGWRFETWVSVNASIAAIGALCCLAVILFVATRICVGDILEGSPALSFFLLIALLISYSVTLPFSFELSGTKGYLKLSAILCDLRVAGPPLSYSILFSILFSRSLMLAASDQDGGFMSHVNGYLQAIIIFFTSAVQFMMSLVYWLFNSFLYSPSTSCQSIYSSHKFILLFSYDIFLIILLMSVIPFMFRSKRNYKEGIFFSIAILTVFFIWGTWMPLYFLLPSAYQDATVVLGLTGTSTAILVCIFIPRTYLMTTAIVRDKIVNTLPPLVHTDRQFRSTQALYDSLNLTAKGGTPNPNFYAVNPVDSGHGTPQIRPGEYYSNYQGLKVPSPNRNKGRDDQDSNYQDFGSPVRSPSHVTRF